MKIFIHGSDGIGWSIDKDRLNLESLILSSDDFLLTKNLFRSKIIHNLWWDLSLNWRHYFLLKFSLSKIILTASNFIDLDDPSYSRKKDFIKANQICDIWIAPSKKQKEIFDRHGINSFYFPFSIDLKIFNSLNDIETIKQSFISKNKLYNKVIISSFQRDTLSDLVTPKWQKNPSMLIKLLSKIDKSKFVLLIAGPRRHFLIKRCNELEIPYIFIGHISNEDDLETNSLPIEEINFYYNLSDLYLITSKSEGGPKAVLESIKTNTLLISNNVGFSSDFINSKFIANSESQFSKILVDVVNNLFLDKDYYQEIKDQQLNHFNKIFNSQNRLDQLKKIYNLLK